MSAKKKIGCVTIVVLVFVLLLSACMPAPVCEFNDISAYGVIIGNYDNERPKEFIFSFFPKTVEEYFSDVRYHYKAKKGDTYAYEMYLEFAIQDTQAYKAYIADVIGDNDSESFVFDPDYQIYYISNYLYLSPALTRSDNGTMKEDKAQPPAIEEAEIGAVLFSDSEQCIIFVALGVYDGGGTYTDELNYFFDRFGINPWAYMKTTV